jgi:5'-nucleotidase
LVVAIALLAAVGGAGAGAGAAGGAGAGAGAVDSVDISPRLKRITLLQVNDVYQEEPVDGGARGGLARVSTLRKQILQEQPNTLFLLAGDTLSPSVASRFFKGKQMVACWNALGIDYAVLGNHEFDFGNEVLKERIAESKFQWVCANVIDKTTGKQFDNLAPYVIREVGGIKLGIIGLLTPDTMRSSHAGKNIEITDPCKTAKRYVPEMRAQGAQVIVALTHLLMGTDKQVAHCVPIDAIIGGHEHVVLDAVAHGTPIIKSGSDARNLGRIDISYSPEEKKVYSVDWEMIPVTDKIADDAAVRALIHEFDDKLKADLDQPAGDTTVALDAMQADNRSQETNLGDFIADAFRKQTSADVAIVNGGSIRSNTTLPPGKLSRRDVVAILPFDNPVVKLEMSGHALRKALENGVSQVEKRAGRFPQVSGLKFEYDASRAAGARIRNVYVGAEPLVDGKTYTVATNGFVAEGGDGYTMFENQRNLISPEEGEVEAVVLLNAIAAGGSISPQVEGRIKRLDSPG